MADFSEELNRIRDEYLPNINTNRTISDVARDRMCKFEEALKSVGIKMWWDYVPHSHQVWGAINDKGFNIRLDFFSPEELEIMLLEYYKLAILALRAPSKG